MKVSSENPDFCNLIEQLDQELWKRYPQTQQFFNSFNKVKLDANVIVAFERNEPVGCGCFRETEDQGVVEMKRMYVKEEKRGRGIAKAILRGLEEWARNEGNHKAILETGINQPEAIALYKNSGYQPIPNYGPYVDIDESVCMGKEL